MNPDSKNQKEVLIRDKTTERSDPEMADINLDLNINFSKAKQAITNIFALTSLTIKNAFKEKETQTGETPTEEEKETENDEESTDSFADAPLDDEEPIVEPEKETKQANIEIDFFKSTKEEDKDKFETIQIENYILTLSSPGIKRYVKLTSSVSLVQLVGVLIWTLVFSGGRYYKHLTPEDLLWALVLLASSLAMLKKFRTFRHLRKTTIFFFLLDSFFATLAYSLALQCPSLLSLVYLASCSISLSILILNSVNSQISQKKAFKVTLAIYILVMTLVFLIFSWEFRFLNFAEKVLFVGVIGTFAGHIASARIRILGERLEMKDMSITLEDCICIGVGANSRGLLIAMKKTTQKICGLMSNMLKD